ncbi:MAG TPA: cupin domain-containing protein [Pseudomonadales bacterium]
MAEVGTRKLFENDRIILWEMTLEPGESTGMHTHEHEYFFHVLSGSVLETLDAGGRSLGESEFRAGKTYYLTLDGDELVLGNARAPAKHDAKNVGSGRYHEILVELKK